MERLNSDEIRKIVEELKKTGKYKEYQEMISDDYENHQVVYSLDEEEIIAIAHKNSTIPYKLKEFYDWHEMNLLVEEDDGLDY